MRKVSLYLIISAFGTARVVKRAPKLGWHETGYRLNLLMPEMSGRLMSTPIEIKVPQPPNVELEGIDR